MSILDELSKTRTWIVHRHPHEADAPILKISHLSVHYESGAALDDISFELTPGERLAVVGPNGAGKSTLFKVIAGMLAQSEGQVHVYGHEPDGHICIGYVPQRSQVDWNFPVTVAEVVMMGRIGKIGLLRNPTSRDWEVVRHSLEVVGINQYARRQISQLSGGQQQRMFIARALAQEAELMLMDEPFSGLDISSQDEIFSILMTLKAQGVTVMVAMHDLKLAAERFDRVMLLNRQMIALGKPEEALQSQNLIQAYGGRLHLLDTHNGALALADSCCDEEANRYD